MAARCVGVIAPHAGLRFSGPTAGVAVSLFRSFSFFRSLSTSDARSRLAPSVPPDAPDDGMARSRALNGTSSDDSENGGGCANVNDSIETEDAGWTLAADAVAKAFGASGVREPAKATRLGRAKHGKDEHRYPQVFYCTRTHAQVAQVAKELDKLGGSAGSTLKMNIMAGRDRLCINRRVRGADGVPHENNNLGEICDKLVAVGQCSAVSRFGSLAQDVLDMGPMVKNGSRRAGAPRWWDLEDLVQEGMSRDACPYYAAREMAYDADLNLCTYNYLFDPIIRSETKFERSLRHAVVVVDEAHNIQQVCQDALTFECRTGCLLSTLAVDVLPLLGNESRVDALRALFGANTDDALALVASERRDKMHTLQSATSGDAATCEAFALQYPREFQLPARLEYRRCLVVRLSWRQSRHTRDREGCTARWTRPGRRNDAGVRSTGCVSRGSPNCDGSSSSCKEWRSRD
jgi:hypothetical protein